MTGRQQQLEERMKENRLAREESLQRREELIQLLEQERLTLRQEKDQQEGARTSRMQEINAQVCIRVTLHSRFTQRVRL